MEKRNNFKRENIKKVNFKRKSSKTTKGITLVALVVTIILLLILAGVAINLTVGNNGLFKRAQNATNTWKKAEINEKEEMKNFENMYDETLNNLGLENGGGNTKKPIGEITGNETTKTDTTDKEGNRIVVPAGFKVVNPESTVNEGIVIEDVSAGDSNTVGNQFVWIPCEIETEANKDNGKLKYDRYAFTRDDWDYRQTKLAEKDADGSYKIQRANDTLYYYHEALLEDERTSIEQNGGYYIGRYEVGTDSARTESSKGNIEAVGKIKKNLPVYNYITRNEAKTIAERMYEEKSKLCSSYAWDTVLKFIDGETGIYAVNSEGGNYTGNGGLKNTGYHGIKNIYDMGGNVWEWTTETYSDSGSPCVPRGGGYYSSLSDTPAGFRNDSSTSLALDDLRFQDYFIYVDLIIFPIHFQYKFFFQKKKVKM